MIIYSVITLHDHSIKNWSNKSEENDEVNQLSLQDHNIIFVIVSQMTQQYQKSRIPAESQTSHNFPALDKTPNSRRALSSQQTLAAQNDHQSVSQTESHLDDPTWSEKVALAEPRGEHTEQMVKYEISAKL